MDRIRDNSRTVNYVGTEHNTVLGVPHSSASMHFSAINPDVMTDVVTPGFRKLSARGSVVNSPMTKHKGERILHEARGVYTDSSYGHTYEWGGQWPAYGSFDPMSHPEVQAAIAKAEPLAIASAYAGVGSPDIAVLTELVELKETLGFLMSPVKGMVTLTKRFNTWLKRAKRISERDAVRRAKWAKLPPHVQAKRGPVPPVVVPEFRVGRWKGTDVSSAWLAYRYGLMPLIYTFQDAEKLLKKRLEGSPIRATARGRAKETVNFDSLSKNDRQYVSLYFDFIQAVTGIATVESRAGVLYEVDASLLTQLGVSWNRVPMALYESIPFSFVSDWFHNGADVYDALTAEFRAQKILTAWVSTEVKYDVLFHEVYGPVTSGNGYVDGFVLETQRGKWKRRKPVSLSDVKLSFRTELNVKRVADGLALIHTFLSTGKI